jgi:hypothetical protein
MRTLYVGQKPSTPLVLRVTDTQGQRVALSGYAAVQMLIKSPSGAMINDATAVLTTSENKVTYAWGTASIFTEPGDYRFQLKMTTPGNVVDYSTIVEIEVLKSLEAA